MPVDPAWKKWARRVWSLGYSRLFMVFAILFSVIALATPMWAVTQQESSTHWDTSVYGLLGVTTDHYAQSTYDWSEYHPFSGPSFNQHVLASAIGASFALVVVYAVVLAIAVALFSLEWARRMSRLALLIITVFIVIVALAALLYPVVAVPGAAAADFQVPAMGGGFWGSTTTPDTFNWGGGLAWWLLLIAVILGCVGVSLPYLHTMRTGPLPPPPQGWNPPQ